MPHSEGGHSNHRIRRDHQPVNTRNLLFTTVLNLVITIVEVAGSILSGSIALLSDAIHNLSDTFATFIAYMASLIGKRKATPGKTFGYKRVEILAALLNAVILIVTCVFLIMEAYERLKEPQQVKSLIMVVVAMIGLLANLYAVLILKRDVHKSINVKAAYIHLLGDVFSSVLVVIGGLLMQIRKLYWIDPLITLLISIYILREAFIILKEAVNILMQSAPSGLDIAKIRERVESVPGIKNIHHLHAWMLTDQEVHLEAHVEMAEDLKLSQVRAISQGIETMLKQDFQVHHVTLQFEHGSNHPPRLIHQVQKP